MVNYTHLMSKSHYWIYFCQLPLLSGLLHGYKRLYLVPGIAGNLGLPLPTICDAPVCYHTVDENTSLNVPPLPEAFVFQQEIKL